MFTLEYTIEKSSILMLVQYGNHNFPNLKQQLKKFKQRIDKSENTMYQGKEVLMWGKDKKTFKNLLKQFLQQNSKLQKLIIYTGHSIDGDIFIGKEGGIIKIEF